MHQGGKYQELSDILKDTFNFSKQTNQFILCKEVTIDRVEHLQILLDSLWQLQQYEVRNFPKYSYFFLDLIIILNKHIQCASRVLKNVSFISLLDAKHISVSFPKYILQITDLPERV